MDAQAKNQLELSAENQISIRTEYKQLLSDRDILRETLYKYTGYEDQIHMPVNIQRLIQSAKS